MLIGIDLGTTALKVAAFDTRSGRLLAGVSKRLGIEVDNTGRREQSPVAILRNLNKCIQEIGVQLGGLGKVRGLGISAQGGSSCIVDRNTGKALTPLTLWNDSRAFSEFEKLVERKSANYWRSFSLRDEPGMGLARIQALRNSTPALFQPPAMFVGVGEYLFYHLTGQWRQDAGNALQIGCYDARHQKITARGATLVDARLSLFAPMRQGHETQTISSAAEQYFGLPSGIPVAGPYMDHEAGFMSTEHVSTAPLQCSLGTAWVGNFCVPDSTTGHSPIQLAVPSPKGTGRLIVQPLLTGNTTWDWALDCFVDSKHSRALVKQEKIFADALLPSEALVSLPWLNRPNSLAPGKHGGCSFIGVAPSTTQADFVRAVAAGMCYELARIFAEAKEQKVFDSVVLSGGASKGLHFQQMLTALFSPLPVYQVTEEDWMGARGCLRPFSLKVSRGKTRRLRASKNLDLDALLQGYAVYQTAMDSLCTTVPAGKAYAMNVQKEKR